MDDKKVVVLLSGGQDSGTLLFQAKNDYDEVIAIFFDYQQRHIIEKQCAIELCKLTNIKLIEINTDFFSKYTVNALTNTKINIESQLNESLPTTFVPGRNLLFLNLAAVYCFSNNIQTIMTGVCEVDSAGYPDCRYEFIQSAEDTIKLALAFHITIKTPLIHLNKREIWLLAKKLGCLNEIIHHTHTCYNGDRTMLHAWGYGCGKCIACNLRQKGFEMAFIQE